jgi:hypothetical protein
MRNNSNLFAFKWLTSHKFPWYLFTVLASYSILLEWASSQALVSLFWHLSLMLLLVLQLERNKLKCWREKIVEWIILKRLFKTLKLWNFISSQMFSKRRYRKEEFTRLKCSISFQYGLLWSLQVTTSFLIFWAQLYLVHISAQVIKSIWQPHFQFWCSLILSRSH